MKPATTTKAPDKRLALLDATCDLIASRGLHNTPISAIAKKAELAAGTLYLYFQNKEVLINEVFLHLKQQWVQYVEQQIEPAASLEERFRQFWHAYAQWHLDHPLAFNVIQQCETSGVLSAETIHQQETLEMKIADKFEGLVEENLVKNHSRQVIYAFLTGPIISLCHMQAKGEIEVTNEVLDQTFALILSGIQPTPHP